MMNVDNLFDEFMKLTEEYCQLTKKVSEGLEEGHIPLREERNKAEQLMSRLVKIYDYFYGSAEKEVTKDKLPEYGSSLINYYGILMERKRQKMKTVQKVLKQFIAVKSKNDNYAEALNSYQQNAKKWLEQVSKCETFEACEEQEKNVNGVVLFLRAMECKNLDSEEGIKLLMEVSGLYSSIIAIGLSRQMFYGGEEEKGIEDSVDNTVEKPAVKVLVKPKVGTSLRSTTYLNSEQRLQVRLLKELDNYFAENPGTKLPRLQEEGLKVGAFVRRAWSRLLASGFELTDKQIEKLLTVKYSKEYTRRNLAFWVKVSDSAHTDLQRYWTSTIFRYKGVGYYVFSQWYPDDLEKGDAHKSDFLKLYLDIARGIL